MFSRRPEFLWMFIVSLVLLLAVWWIPGSGSVNTDSYSVAYGGKKVLYQAMSRLDSRISRSADQLVPDDVFSAGRILILGPARHPSAEEWDALHDAVWYGNSVVFAVQSGDPHVDAGPFGVRVVGQSVADIVVDLDQLDESALNEDENGAVDVGSADAELSNSGDDDVDTVESNSEPEEIDSSSSFSEFMGQQRATSRLISGDVAWQSSGRIEMDNDDDWEVLVRANSTIQAVQQRIGDGTFTLIASDEIFCNGAMLEPERALLAWRILESASMGHETLFDETLNSTGVPKVLGLLFDPLFRPITLQLILIAVLFGWLGSQRFGPALRSRHGRRRSVVEHAKAVGSLYFRAGAGARAVHCFHEFLKQELRSRFGQGFQVDSAERVARQARVDQRDVQKLFDEIRQFSDSKRSSATASRLLKSLSELLVSVRHQAEGDRK